MGTWDLHALHYFRSWSLLLTCLCHYFIIILTSLIFLEFTNTCTKGNRSEVSGESLQNCSDLGGWHSSECCVLLWTALLPPGGETGEHLPWKRQIVPSTSAHKTAVLQQKEEAFSRDSVITVLIRCTIKLQKERRLVPLRGNCCQMLNACMGGLACEC